MSLAFTKTNTAEKNFEAQIDCENIESEDFIHHENIMSLYHTIDVRKKLTIVVLTNIR